VVPVPVKKARIGPANGDELTFLRWREVGLRSDRSEYVSNDDRPIRAGHVVRGRLGRVRLRLAVVLPVDDSLALLLLLESVPVGIDAVNARRIAWSTVGIRFTVFRVGRTAGWTAVGSGRLGPDVITVRGDGW
jgi:hypothetical protein